MTKLFHILIILISSYTFSLAQVTNNWDLQTCIDYAQKHNISLKQAEIQARISKNNYVQSEANILPTFNAGAQHTYNYGRTIDRFTNTFANSQVLSQNFYVSSNVVLWSGFAQYNNIKANQYQYLANTENYLQQQNDLALNIATNYINVIFSEEILTIAKTSYSLTAEQLVRTEKLVNEGALAKSVLYDLKAQLANDNSTVINADNNYQISLLTLKQLLNLDSVNQFNITRPQIEITPSDLSTLSVQTIYETALNNQHSIKSAQYGLLASEKTLNVAKGKLSPTLSATGSLGTGTSELNKNVSVNIVGAELAPYITQSGESIYTPKTEIITTPKTFSDQFNENVNKSVGFTLSVPIFNGLQNITSVKNAKLNVLNAKYTQDLTEQNLYKTIAQAYANANAGLSKYNANKLSVEAAEQSFNFTQQKFNAGAISVFDFNTAKTRLQNAQSNLIQSKYDYIFKLKVLDYYQGKELKF